MSSAFLNTAMEVDAEQVLRISSEIQAVEEILCQEVESQVPLVRDVGELTLTAGGKRLRPALVALSALACDESADLERARKLGACMEMIHMATLIHDDVIDHAAQRRGKPTAASVFGNTASILTGDVLLAKAMRILALDGDLEIIRLVSSIVVDLAEGEVAELETRGNLNLSELEHRSILLRKTATFIEACCRVGAMSVGAPQRVVDGLGSYGRHLGLAFQIIDDLLDYRGVAATTGKPRGTDFCEGCATLPLIRLLPKLSDDELSFVRESFGADSASEALASVHSMMEAHGAFAECDAAANAEFDEAMKALHVLPQAGPRRLLEEVSNFVLQRHH